jgi:hypothetical protein
MHGKDKKKRYRKTRWEYRLTLSEWTHVKKVGNWLKQKENAANCNRNSDKKRDGIWVKKDRRGSIP